jgi:hypothetical protein
MPDSETPESVVARIEAIPEEDRTKAQRSALNRALHAIKTSAKEGERVGSVLSTAPFSPTRTRGAEAESSEGQTVTLGLPPDEACPDPLDPQASRALYAAFYRRLWALAHSAKATNMDVISGFSAAKGAAGVGKEAPPPEARVLDMASILGNGVASDGEEGA